MSFQKLYITFIFSILINTFGTIQLKSQTNHNLMLATDTLVSASNTDSLQPQKVVTLRLVKIQQYMQSVQLIFELENNSENILNNCWFHASLLDSNHLFLYREQPLLFNGLAGHGKQMIELLCESVGIEEVAFVSLRMQLLEIDRVETLLSSQKVNLVQNDESSVIMQFKNY